MTITIKVDSRFLPDSVAGYCTVEVEGKNVGECLNELVEKVPEIKSRIFTKDSQLTSTVQLIVNQRTLLTQGLEKTVKDGDVIELYVEGE